MKAILQLLPIFCAILPFIAMPLLWRRMKRVRDGAYRQIRAPTDQQPWEEPIADRHGLMLSRESDPNDELIALGDKARNHRWPLNND